MTLSKQLKTYITERFKLNYQETWACETIDAVAEDVLPEKYIKNSPLEHKILNILLPITMMNYMKSAFTLFMLSR